MHGRQSLTLGDLAKRIDARLCGDPRLEVNRVATLEQAEPGALSFLSHKKYRRYLKGTMATAVVLAKEDVQACPAAALVHNNPYLAYAKATRLLYPLEIGCAGVHPSALIDPTAQIDITAWIGPLTVIGPQVHIGARTYIGAACVLESGCKVGCDSRLMARVILCRESILGNRVFIQPGAVIGADGFGFARAKEGWLRIPQIGRVVIGDDVEIGANTTIDRGSLDDTIIANGAILDNLIQIGHNVHIGERTAIAACTGISGSTKIGRDCLLGGDVGIAGHLEIGDEVCLAAGSKVHRALQGPGRYGGVLPVDSEPLWRRNIAQIRRLNELVHQVRQLERQDEDVARNGEVDDTHNNATPDI